MSVHELKAVIEAADDAITAEDFETLMAFYADDATLVIQAGMNANGKEEIRRAFVAIADYFNHSMVVKQGDMVVLESGDTALVLMETLLDTVAVDGTPSSVTRRATYVFRKNMSGKWECIIDNSYGTDLLGA